MLKGSCDATAPAPSVTPERLRKLRRSIVLARTPERPRARRDWGRAAAAAPEALRVRSMRNSSNLGGAVVVVDVLGGVIAARGALVAVRCRFNRRTGLRHDRGSSRCASGSDGQEEVTPGKALGSLVHTRLLLIILCTPRTILEHFKCRMLNKK